MRAKRRAPHLWMVASTRVRPQDLEHAMKPLSVTLVLFGVLALLQPARQLDLPGALLGVVVLLCAATTFRSTGDIELSQDICRHLFDRDNRVWSRRVGWQGRALAG